MELHNRIKAALIARGRKEIAVASELTALWCAQVAVLTVWYSRRAARSWTDLRAYIPLLLLILPFYPFRVQRTLRGRTGYCTVTKREHLSRIRSDGLRTVAGRGGYGRVSNSPSARTERTLRLTLTADDGRRETIDLPEDNVHVEKRETYYREGDRVYRVHGLRYPVRCPLAPDAPLLCPRCGRLLAPGRRECKPCRLSLNP